MTSSLSTTFSASSSATAKVAGNSLHYSNRSLSKLSFRLSLNPRLRFFTKGLHGSQNNFTVVKGQLNEGAAGGTSNAAGVPRGESTAPAAESNAESSGDAPPALATEEYISEFLAQVSSLVKLVDSRDIVELQLKQFDCELLIRKKEALPQPPSSAPVVMMHSPSTLPAMAPTPTAPAPAPSVSAPSATPPPPIPSAPKSAMSSLPPLKCPMAGTFYRSPAPGEPALVKIGDQVQKGQILCIIEAMKLMNEIEADRSGTIVEILVEDGKPVSVDQPLFVIQP